MATVSADQEAVLSDAGRSDDSIDLGKWLWQALKLAGSLKLTVALFAVSLLLVFVGTLAQDDLSMVDVKNRYFVTWIAWLHLDDFFPTAFFPSIDRVPGILPFLGGKSVGLLLLINLVAAKVTRFKVQGKGRQLMTGVAFLTVGLVLTLLVVLAGHSGEGVQGNPPISYQNLWRGLVVSIWGGVGLLTYAGFSTKQKLARGLAFSAAAIIALAMLRAHWTGTQIDEPGLRIVWQLTKGLGAGVILLIGCLYVFGRQGGNVLLHLGVGLLMVGQFVFGDRQLEQRLTLVEGQSTNSLINLDEVELTFIRSVDGVDEVAAIPMDLLAASVGDVIESEDLPVKVRVRSIMKNSVVLPKTDNVPPPSKDAVSKSWVGEQKLALADTGIGATQTAIPRAPSGGTDGEVNVPSAIVDLIDRQTDQPMGTYLVSLWLSDRAALMPTQQDVSDRIEVDGAEYAVGLKYHREVKPYWVQLKDVRRVTYSGSSTPRDFSSFVRIVDQETGKERNERIWMNNPLRYRGETFYQSNYQPLPGGKELTGIQVVKNGGWLIPYVACSITALGMLAHFLGTLMRFVSRRERSSRHAAALMTNADSGLTSSPQVTGETGTQPEASSLLKRHWVTASMGALAFVLAVYTLVPWQAASYRMNPGKRLEQFDWHAAGGIPTQFGGRMMPLDAYARQTLKSISNRESLKVDEHTPAGIASRAGKKVSALHWLMELATDSEDLRGLRMFRIDAEEVRSELGLERRKSKLYSLDEIGPDYANVAQQVEAARDKPRSALDFKERKLIELDDRTRVFTLAAAAFRLPVPDLIPKEDFERLFPGGSEAQRQAMAIGSLRRKIDALRDMQAPAIVAPTVDVTDQSVDFPRWQPFSVAFFDQAASSVNGEVGEAPPGMLPFSEMIAAYDTSSRDPAAFNRAVDQLHEEVDAEPIAGYVPWRLDLERWMASNSPTYAALFIYIMAMVIGLINLMINSDRIRWGTLAMIIVAFAVHTLAIYCRMAVTGRAPVINLYSSAVFIGWAGVLFGIGAEYLFRYGIGNLLAAFSGVGALLIAYGLTFTTTDTMPVLLAVLDTQFWLATHVISVTLGYVATLVAGLLGIGYLIVQWFRLDGTGGVRTALYKCVYGAACFGILFSFVGTVLGGLWADDSWGRFWGWDPKENGALLIVIWNALMLHARWDRMVGPRGFASLAIGGNIVTAWSWFGTNELNIGLHSYGFTEGVLMFLSVFVLSQLAIIGFDFLMRAIRHDPSPGAS